MKAFEKWWDSLHPKTNAHVYCDDCNGFVVCAEWAWKAALEWVLSKTPNNDKATFANQGQGMDGYTELANYKQLKNMIEEELKDE